MSREDFIIAVYLLVDEMFQKIIKGSRLRRRGFGPKLTDSEVITMEIVGEFLGMDSDKGIWEYFQNHWLHWFPRLGSRATFVKQAANLWKVKQKIQQDLAKRLGSYLDELHMADGFPIPVCRFKRAYFSRCFKRKASYGYCASKDEKYYGFKGNLMINSQGVITQMTMTAANVDERESLWDIVEKIHGLVIADKGLVGEDLKQQLQEQAQINLQTPLRANMVDSRSKGFRNWLVSTRRLVETVIGQLTERFHIQVVRARDLWHLTHRIARKLLAHTVAVFLNKMNGNPCLQFDKLISS